jgi:hypothetical protein
MATNFRDFHQYLQAKAGVLTSNYVSTASFHIPDNSLSTEPPLNDIQWKVLEASLNKSRLSKIYSLPSWNTIS